MRTVVLDIAKPAGLGSFVQFHFTMQVLFRAAVRIHSPCKRIAVQTLTPHA